MDGGKVQVNDGGGWGCGRDRVWRGTGCGEGQSVPVRYCLGKEAVFVVVVGGGYLSVFVWVVGSCLAVSGHEVFITQYRCLTYKTRYVYRCCVFPSNNYKIF